MARRRIEIESDRSDQPLPGRLFTPQDPTGSAILFIHGFGGHGRSNEHYAKRAVRKGIASLTFDLSGPPGIFADTGSVTVNDHLADAGHAFDFLRSTPGVDEERIGIAGMSYGGYLAALLSANKPTKSLLLRSPPLYPDELRDKPRHEYTDEEALRSDPELAHSALEALQGFAGRVVLVDPGNDEVIPSATFDAYENNGHDVESRVLRGGSMHHLGQAAQQAFNGVVAEWATNL